MIMPEPSPTHLAVQVLRIAGPLHRDLLCRTVDLTQVLGRQLERGGPDVLLEALPLGRARNRHYPRLLRQEPGQRQLSARHVLAGRDDCQHIHQSAIGLAGLRREARNDVAKVGTVKNRVLIDLAGEKSPPERTERHKANAQFLERRQNLRLGLAPPQRILALQSGNGLHGMGATNGLGARLGQAEMPDLALPCLLYTSPSPRDGLLSR